MVGRMPPLFGLFDKALVCEDAVSGNPLLFSEEGEQAFPVDVLEGDGHLFVLYHMEAGDVPFELRVPMVLARSAEVDESFNHEDAPFMD